MLGQIKTTQKLIKLKIRTKAVCWKNFELDKKNTLMPNLFVPHNDVIRGPEQEEKDG